MTTSFPADQRDACTGGETLVPGELRGFRRWRLSTTTPLGLASLRGVGPDAGAWRVKEHAECRVGGWRPAASWALHDAPLLNCDCGIYAWYRPDLVDGAASCPCGCGAGYNGSETVVGAVAAAGRVLLGTRGFRAARARITGLVVPAEQRILRTTMAGSGVALFDTLADLVAAQPPQDDLAALGVDVAAISPAPEERIAVPLRWPPGGFAPASLSFDTQPFIDAMRRASQQMDAAVLRQRRWQDLFASTSPSPAMDPATLALELRRVRNTGPATRARAPKSIDARGAR